MVASVTDQVRQTLHVQNCGKRVMISEKLPLGNLRKSAEKY